MVNHFCTITTQSHLYKTRALIQSVQQQQQQQQTEAQFHVLVIDGDLPKENDALYYDTTFLKQQKHYR